MLDCLFIGSTTEDILLTVDTPPASDQRIAASSLTYACGGIASVAASAFQKLGGKAGLMTAVGDPSEVTSFIRRDIEARELPYAKLIGIPGTHSPISTIQVEPDGKRCITHYGGCIRKLTMEMVDKEILSSTRMIHLGGLAEDFSVELAAYCRKHTSALISVDNGNLSGETTERLLPYTDVLVPDDKTVKKTLGMTPEEACRYYVSGGVKIACVTMGDKGSVAFDGKEMTHAAPFRVRVADTTGAGDNFHGAFLFCLLQGWDLARSLRFCNAFSALTCRGIGGISAEPSLEETMKKMEE